MKRPATVAAVVALLAVAGGVAYATIPDAGGVIHGCYKTSSGALRVIDHPAESCLPSETSIEWSETGPSGPSGPSGSSGPSGPAGSALGYAYVAQDGSLFNSKGVLQVTHPSTGVWCFDLDFTAHVAVATVTGFAGLGNQIIHTSISPGAGDACVSANPADAAAFMVLPDGTRTDYQFFIEFN
jgi:hypothetical protein